jgi:hypothetical protein
MRKDEFYFVRVSDKKTALQLKATRTPEAIFIDGDAHEYFRADLKEPRILRRAMDSALEKFAPRPIAWAAQDAAKRTASSDEKRLTLLAFADDKKDSAETLKALEDKTVAKLHDRFHFVRVAYRPNSEDAKKWSVIQAPTLLVLDPARGAVLHREGGKKDASRAKAFLLDALAKLEKK